MPRLTRPPSDAELAKQVLHISNRELGSYSADDRIVLRLCAARLAPVASIEAEAREIDLSGNRTIAQIYDAIAAFGTRCRRDGMAFAILQLRASANFKSAGEYLVAIQPGKQS